MKAIIFMALMSTMLYACNEIPSHKTNVVAQTSKATAQVSATCSGDKSCTACKNCKYCKHCSKDGGSCGVCK